MIGFATLINEGLAGATVQIVMQKTPDNIPRIFGLYREVGKSSRLDACIVLIRVVEGRRCLLYTSGKEQGGR